MSRRPAAHDATDGADVRAPPNFSQPDQVAPLEKRCHSALSWPLARMSIRLVPQDTAAGADVITPPSDSHGDHALPFHIRCQRALSLPRTNMSVRDPPQEEAATEEVPIAPRLVQPLGSAMLIVPVLLTPNDHL